MVGQKDIDFDEIDRAVNSAIKQSDVQKNPMTVDNNQTSSTSALSMPQIPSRPTVERPNTGRFLDMVRPNSITKSQPTSQDIIQKPITSQDVASTNPNNISVNQNEKFSMPVVNKSNNQFNPDELKESPFIPDAKVEKRPLNASSSEVTDLPSPQTNYSNLSVSQDTNAKNDLPDELRSDLLSIEANEVTKDSADSIEGIKDNELPKETDLVQSTSETLPTEDNLDVEEPMSNSLPEVQVESASEPQKQIVEDTSSKIVVNSIPQQYEEKPSSLDQKNGAIYDVNDYHKPVQLTKKKSGWSFVVWIIILMVLSVGAGVAVYFFVLPQL